ncbi:MAG: aminotransferase class III-fold pyridoxal phosphate-dependent enzyme, partial [Chloroflexi bacterium]|nr:aminotransferase class III-fold pyridoxal phosphate-dependent enzyme [Chloroflexota bacterium]
EETAAILLEVVQGEGGVRVLDPTFIQQAAQWAHERGALLIIDEVQTGLGRTGRMWAHEHVGVIPDLMPIAKSLGGGFPVGACLLGERVGALPAGSHGSTFGGNPLACAAASATLDVLVSEGLVERAASLGAWFRAELAAINSRLIREVRGLGLMVGDDLRIKVTPVLKALEGQGILALPAGPTVLRFLPPLVITREELRQVRQVLADILQTLAK